MPMFIDKFSPVDALDAATVKPPLIEVGSRSLSDAMMPVMTTVLSSLGVIDPG